MLVPENLPVLSDIIGDADIHQIIEERLTPWDIGHRNTEKFLVEGMSEVVLRYNGDDFTDLPTAKRVAAVYNQLPLHDIATLPYVVTEHAGQIYVVTRKLHGYGMLEVATPDASDDIRQQVDRRWTRLIDYARNARQQGLLAAPDIFDPTQHMFGRTSVDTEDDIRLVDLDTSAKALDKNLRASGYEFMILSASESIVTLESGLDRHLSMARLAFTEAAELGHDLLIYGDNRKFRRAHINAAQYILEHQIHLPDNMDEEELVERFS